jgi:hypothetical protein
MKEYDLFPNPSHNPASCPPQPQSKSQNAALSDEELLKSIDKNHAIFRNALLVFDAVTRTHARIIDDFVCSRPVRKIVVDGVERVDYDSYLRELDDSPDGATVERVEDDCDTVIFGGAT